jgi:SAM-dependent methyltransferase
MDPRLQRRVQRCGWNLAAAAYDTLWRAQLAPLHARLAARAALAAGERVLDVACGTGLVSLAAAEAVGPGGRVIGVDLSERMVEAARRRASRAHLAHASFARMDAEALDVDEGSVDVVLCALGLMYMPDPQAALRSMRRALADGGRAVLAVWGARLRCGFAPLFGIVADEIDGEVCPMFFALGRGEALARQCAAAGFGTAETERFAVTLHYPDADAACNAAFVAGPVALAWSRFDDHARARVRTRYCAAIAPWKNGRGYRIPGEFVVVTARASHAPLGASDSLGGPSDAPGGPSDAPGGPSDAPGGPSPPSV